MFNRIGFSSEIYRILAKDIISLPDNEIDEVKIQNGIVIIISSQGDKLVCGRDIVNKAINNGEEYVNIRVAFKMRYPVWKLHITLIKKLRDRKRIISSNYYHIDPQYIRDLDIERAFRTLENAKHYYLLVKTKTHEEVYKELEASIIKNGYKDDNPMDIHLCRSLGVQDTLNQGHHRMGILVANNIKPATFKFSAVGYIGGPFKCFLSMLAKRKLKSKYK